MKHRYLLAFLALAGLTASAPAVAQSTANGPWAVLPTSPPFCNCGLGAVNIVANSDLQLPTAAVWVVRRDPGVHGRLVHTILGSADNGLTWQNQVFIGQMATAQTGGIASGTSVRSLFALDGQRAWAVLNQLANGTTQVLQTTTGAAGFAVAPGQPTGLVSFLRFADASNGIAIGQPTATGWPVQRTSDGGLTWVPVTSLPAALAGTQPLGITQLGAHLWVTMGGGKVLHTPDAGQTWTVATTAQDLAQLTFRDYQNGLAVSNNTASPLFRTSDGGTTWSPVATTGPRRRKALAAVPGSAGTYLSVGQEADAGTAISYNDGQTWQDLGGTSWLDGLAVTSPGRVWASFYGTGDLARYGGAPLASRPARLAQLALYPNPTTGMVALAPTGEFRQAQVVDATGRLCLTLSLPPQATTLDLTSLQAGMYLVRLQGGTGGLVQQQLVVAR